MEFNKTLKNFGAFTKTLADNKDELFGTLTQVEDFTNTLAKNDGTVRKFNDSLASGADLLADEREELAAVLKNLSIAMVQVRSFVKENRASLTSNISGLNRISKTLVKRRDALDEILQYAPAALNNLYLAGNVKQGTLDTRDNVGELLTQLEDRPGRRALHPRQASTDCDRASRQALTAAPASQALRRRPVGGSRGCPSRSTGPWAASWR